MSAHRPPPPTLRRRRAGLALLPLVALACASLPAPRPGPAPPPLVAVPPGPPTHLERLAAELGQGQPPGHSGFGLLEDGESALQARLQLIDLADRTLDLQTYIWELDRTGRLVLAHVLAAADRGVAVRILLDDTALQTHEAEWGALDLHPHVEVRAFNPFLWGRGPSIGQALEFLLDFERLNRRMHNKALIADEAFAVVGGRNFADAYFARAESANFRDLDLVAAGPAAGDASRAFAIFWESRWASPLPPLRFRPARPTDLDRLRERLGTAALHADGRPPAATSPPGETARELARTAHELLWAHGRVLVDDPRKIGSGPREGNPASELLELLRHARGEILAEVAYLVPPTGGIEVLDELSRRGVRLRILTNSLATNDVVAAHAGYANSRPALVDAGVELYELRPDADRGTRHTMVTWPGSHASLHSKTLVLDGETIFVGSLNRDGRSIFYNTEIGILVESPELARRVIAFLDRGCLPESAWRVARRESVDPAVRGTPAGKRLVWIERRSDGSRKLRHHEPRAGLWRRIQAFLYSHLPIERHL